MRVTARFALLIAALFLTGATGWSQQTIPLLKAGGETFTNAVIKRVTATHVFFRHAGGFSSAKLSDLDPELQNEIAAYIPPVAQHAGVGPGASGAGGTNREDSDEAAGTNGRSGPPPGWVAKDYPLGDAGTLTLVFPDLWKDSVQTAPTNAPPYVTIRFKRPYGDDFLLQIVTIPADDKLVQQGARGVMTTIGKRALRGAVEKELDLKELNGSEAHGYYFAITDKKLADVPEPKPGTYKYQMQGLVFVGEFALNFTILNNYPASTDPAAALETIRTASFSEPMQTSSSLLTNEPTKCP